MIKKVPREQLPVKTKEAKVKVSKLEARVQGLLGDVPQHKREILGLSTFNEMNKVEQIRKATQFVTKDPEKAMNVLLGKEQAPKGILRNSIFIALQESAMTTLDKDLALKLASLESTRFGQELSILTELDEFSAAGAVDRLVKIHEKALTKRTIALDKMENGKWKSEADKNKYGIDFGASKVAFENYYSQLSEVAKGKPLANVIETFKNRGIVKGVGVGLETTANFIAENSRAIVASWDNSFWGRQGRKTLGRLATSRDWLNNFQKSFVDLKNVLTKGVQKGNEILDSVKAEIYSRENYLNGRYEKGKKLDIGIREEEFPTSLPEKIPGLGRIFKAAEVTYTAGAMRLRTDIADNFYKMAEKTGVNLKDNTEVGQLTIWLI